MHKVIFITVFAFQSAFAVCTKPVTHIQEGERALCEGYLVTPEKEQELREKVQELQLKNDILNQQDRLFKVKEDHIQNLEKQVNFYSGEVDKRDSRSFWENTAYFALGAILTGVIATGLRK